MLVISIWEGGIKLKNIAIIQINIPDKHIIYIPILLNGILNGLIIFLYKYLNLMTDKNKNIYTHIANIDVISVNTK